MTGPPLATSAGSTSPPSRSDSADAAVLNDYIKYVATGIIAFVGATLYIAITVTSTTDYAFLRGGNVRLPLLGVTVPLLAFSSLAPALIVLLHLNVFLQEYFVALRVDKLRLKGESAVEEALFPALPVVFLVRRPYALVIRALLQFSYGVVMYVTSLATLCLIQQRFLLFHSDETTTWHRSLVVIDVALVVYFRLLVGRLEPPGRAALRWIRVVVVGAFLLVTLAFTSTVAVQHGSCVDWREWFGLEDRRWLRRDIRLANANLQGAILRQRDLRYANLSGAVLRNADLRGSKLEGADLSNADMRDAKLSPAGEGSWMFLVDRSERRKERIAAAMRRRVRMVRVDLSGAKLIGANLRGANLIFAGLRGADLTEADLRDTELALADLSGSVLREVRLGNADLWRARLDDADLFRAHLVGTDFRAAFLRGADLSGGFATGVDFRRADMRSARLHDLSLFGGQFGDARTVGLDLRGATLAAVSGLQLRGVRLRGAFVESVCMERGVGLPSVSDLRGLREDGAAEALEREHVRRSKGELTEPRRLRALLEPLVKASCRGKPSIPGRLMRSQRLLYDEAERPVYMKGWPAVSEQWSSGDKWEEGTFLAELADLLVREACDDSFLAEILMRSSRGLSGEDPKLARALAEPLRDALELATCKGFPRRRG